MSDLYMKVKKIYEHIIDAESKEIFINRLLFNISGNYRFLRQIVGNTNLGKEVSNTLYTYMSQGKQLILDGAGQAGKSLLEDFPGIEWKCISDNNLCPKNDFRDIQIIKREEAVKKYPDAIFVISSVSYHNEIQTQLETLGVPQENIYNLGKIQLQLEDKMYFDCEWLSRQENNLFIDCGAYRGETTQGFLKWCDNAEKNAIVFEPDLQNYLICKQKFDNQENITVINAATYCKTGKVHFASYGTRGSAISGDGTIVNAYAIDDCIEDQKVTFIKMDVEGSEYDTIYGARRTISRWKPDMAISVYHKPEDILDLLELCLDINPDYVFGFKHYTLSISDTVAFAISR